MKKTKHIIFAHINVMFISREAKFVITDAILQNETNTKEEQRFQPIHCVVLNCIVSLF